MTAIAQKIDARRGVESGRRYPAGGRDLGAVEPVTSPAGHSLPDFLRLAWRDHREDAYEALIGHRPKAVRWSDVQSLALALWRSLPRQTPAEPAANVIPFQKRSGR